MHSVLRFLVSSATLAAVCQSAIALQVTNQAPPSPVSATSTGTIERGGTINAVDLAKKTLTIDRRVFTLASTPVMIHGASGAESDKLQSLKPGMQIRFNTTKANYAGQDRITEIWITKAAVAPTKK